MKTLDNLYFEDGLIVHVERCAIAPLFYISAFVKPINPSKYPYRYKVSLSIINKIENGGEYNTHYWHTIKQLIKDVVKISKRKLLRKSYYKV